MQNNMTSIKFYDLLCAWCADWKKSIFLYWWLLFVGLIYAFIKKIDHAEYDDVNKILW